MGAPSSVDVEGGAVGRARAVARSQHVPDSGAISYFAIVRAATEGLATSANTCSIRNRAIVRVRLNALANGLALDQIPYRSSPRVLGDGD